MCRRIAQRHEWHRESSLPSPVAFEISSATDKIFSSLQGNPMAFLVENAGGRAITHKGPVLDIVPTSIHERCPIFLGSKANIDRIEAIFHGMA